MRLFDIYFRLTEIIRENLDYVLYHGIFDEGARLRKISRFFNKCCDVLMPKSLSYNP